MSGVARARAPVCAVLACVGAVQLLGAQTPAPSEPPPQQPPPAFEDSIEVVGATPIRGLGIDRSKIPGNVQTATADMLTRTRAWSVGEQLNAAMPSVHVNEATTNPFQPDLHFRGFVGSPLLGLPQGLAVYQNGVRLNEPFGDTMNWDLLPGNAIASTLTPHLALTARMTNLFDSEYATFGLLGDADGVLGDDYQDPRFLSPGAPRAAWAGLRVSFS